MCRERVRYLEALALYSEAITVVEEHQQPISMANFGLKNSTQVYQTLEHCMVIAEAAQKLRFPLISKDGEICEEEIEKCSIVSHSSLDSTATSATISSSSNSTTI